MYYHNSFCDCHKWGTLWKHKRKKRFETRGHIPLNFCNMHGVFLEINEVDHRTKGIPVSPKMQNYGNKSFMFCR